MNKNDHAGKKNSKNIWWFQKNNLPLHPLSRKKHCYSICNAKNSNGRLAQLVQSICLTSRGSAVRIRQRPQLGSLAQLNRASDYGSEGYRFESYRSHFFFDIISGRIPEWPNGADCKSAGCYLRWFESISAHCCYAGA